MRKIAAVEPPNICTARLWGFAPCWVFRKRQPPVASLEKQPYHFYTPTGLPPARVGKHKNLDEITTTLPLHFCLPQYLSPYICAGINIHRLLPCIFSPTRPAYFSVTRAMPLHLNLSVSHACMIVYIYVAMHVDSRIVDGR